MPHRLPAGEEVERLHHARRGRDLIFAGLECRAAAGQSGDHLKDQLVPDHPLLRQLRGDRGNPGMGRDDQGARLAQRPPTFGIAIEPIPGCAQAGNDDGGGNQTPGQQAEKPHHHTLGPLALIDAAASSSAAIGRPSGTRRPNRLPADHRREFGPPKINDALVPPKPNEFDSTYLTLRSRACFATRSMSQDGDGLSRLSVGGTTPSRSARIEKIASTLPAAPSRCPIADLVEDIDSSYACLPNSRLTAPSSISSPSGVEVPWALM